MTAAKAPARRRRVARVDDGSGGGGGEGSSRQAAAAVMSLDARRIANALDGRTRYKYVSPRVVREGLGWKIVSPNCSRNIDPDGGEIDIAWLVPDGATGAWLLFSRDHVQDCWMMRRRDPRLAPLLEHVCLDPQREFWQ